MKKIFTLFCALALVLGANVAQTAPKALSAKKAAVAVEQVQKVQFDQAKPAVKASLENVRLTDLRQFNAALAPTITNPKAQASAIVGKKAVKANHAAVAKASVSATTADWDTIGVSSVKEGVVSYLLGDMQDAPAYNVTTLQKGTSYKMVNLFGSANPAYKNIKDLASYKKAEIEIDAADADNVKIAKQNIGWTGKLFSEVYEIEASNGKLANGVITFAAADIKFYEDGDTPYKGYGNLVITLPEQEEPSQDINVTATKVAFDDYWYDYYMYVADGFYIFEMNDGEPQIGQSYTFEDMNHVYSGWYANEDGGYLTIAATDATLSLSKDEAGLLHVVGTMVLDGDSYIIKYDEKVFEPSGVQINLDGTELIGQYMSYYGMYVYTAKVGENEIQLAFDATKEQAVYTPDQLLTEYCVYCSEDYSTYVEFQKAASDITITNTETTKTLAGSLYATNGDEYILNLVYEKPDAKYIDINVANATLTNKSTAGFWKIDGQTADKVNSFNIYFISKALQGTFTDVEQFDAYSTWVSDKSSGSNVYYENLSEVNLTSAIVEDSLVIEGTLNLSDSKGNPAIVTVHVSTPFTQTWGEWADFAPFDKNTGKYTFATLGDWTQSAVQVQERKDNTGMKQYNLKNWGKGYFDMEGHDLILNMNPDRTFTFTSPVIDAGVDIYFQDVATAFSNPEYAPLNYYDPESGIFHIYDALIFASNGSVYTVAEETMVMDRPIYERDTVKVTSNMLISAEPSKGIIKVSGEDEDFTYILELVGSDTIGTFSLQDGTLSQKYYYGIVSKDFTIKKDYAEGEVTVSKDDNGIALTGLMIGEDEKAYVFNWYKQMQFDKRDTVYVNADNITSFYQADPVYGYVYKSSNEDYELIQLVTTSDQELGTFTSDDINFNYSAISKDGKNNYKYFQEGEFTVAEDADGFKLTGIMIGEDEKAYVFNLLQPAGILQYDTNAPFDATFAYADMSTSIDNGIIGIYATNAKNLTIGLELYADPASTKIPEGTYTISDSQEDGTALMSQGVAGGYLTECWAGTRGTSGIEDCWFMVEGSITLSYDEYDKLKVIVDAKNSFGQPVTATIKYEKLEPVATVDIKATNLAIDDSYLTQYGLYEYIASNVEYGVLLDVATDTPTGTFKDEIDLPDSYILTADGEELGILEGEITVNTEGKNATLSGWVLATDTVKYVLDFYGYEGAIEGDALEDFTASFSTANMKDVYSSTAKMHVVSAFNEAGDSVQITFKSSTNPLTARTYKINTSKSMNTVIASDGSTLTGVSFAAKASDGEIEQIWHMVSGNVTVDENGNITVEALNSYDKAINITISAPAPDYYLYNYSNGKYLGWDGASTASNKISMMDEANRQAVTIEPSEAGDKLFTTSVIATDDKPMYLSIGANGGFNFKTYVDGGEQGSGYWYKIQDINASKIVADKISDTSELAEGEYYLIVHNYQGYYALGGTATDTDGKGKMRILGYKLASASDKLTLDYNDIEENIYRYVTAATPAPEPRPTEEPVVEGNILDEESFNFNGGTVGKWLSAGSKTAELSVVAPGYNNSAYAMKVTTATAGQNYDTQVKYAGQYLNGHTYSYSFKAKASKDASIVVALQQDGGSYQGVYSAPVALTTEWAEFSGQLTVNGDNFTRFLLNVGETAADYYFDQIVLIDETATTVKSIELNGSDDMIFNVGGQRVMTPVKGNIYIINGEQTLVE